MCFYAPTLSWENSEGVVFSGDTLFNGGPGASRTLLQRLRHHHRVDLDPPADPAESTAVLTGHGDSTGIGLEAPELPAWIKRGH